MEFKLDRNKKYALALEGGGAKGAYEVGVWEALAEEGIALGAVSGTSVGAINGAFVAMGELELAKRLWGELTYSKVMDVDDTMMRKLIKGDFSGLNIADTAKTLKEVLLNKGFDVDPLMELFDEYVDEEKIRKSDLDFYIITVSLTDKKELELKAADLKEGEIHDMMLASAYLPVFKNVKLGGKRYVDGGFADTLPLHVLVENGWKDIVAVALNGIGVDRKFSIPDDVKISYVSPKVSLGKTLDFDPVQSIENLKIGYYDAKKMMYGLYGSKYCIDRTMTEAEAYGVMASIAVSHLENTENRTPNCREINEKILPRLELALKVNDGDYYDVFIAALEAAADEAGEEKYRIITDRELLESTKKHFNIGEGELPKAFSNFFISLLEKVD